MTAAAQNGPARRPVLLFVLGMGRSGTSALTRVLALCGATLPAGSFGVDAGNPRGYWEPRAAVDLNEAILRRHRSNWFDPTLRLQEENAFDAEDRAATISEVRAYLTTLPAVPVVVIKDPRITALCDVWFEAARQTGFDIAVVIAVRHPEEVIPSCAEYVGTSPELSSALWLKYNLLAERHTRGLPRIFVDYTNLLEDWRREIARISTTLAISLKTRDERRIEGFLTHDQRHQRHYGPVTEPFGTDWILEVYEAMRAAARDEPWDGLVLDRVFDGYRWSERAFRTAFEDFRVHSPPDGLVVRLFRRTFVIHVRRLAAAALPAVGRRRAGPLSAPSSSTIR